MSRCILDLDAIEGALRELQRDFDRVNACLDVPRDPMSERVLANMLCGYGYLNRLLIDEVDPLAQGNSHHLLRLNTLVLHGLHGDPASPALVAADRHFYDQTSAGSVGHVIDYAARMAGESVWKRAAGVFIHILSEPQLFLEGNHRTGSLVISHLLCQAGEGPFVLTPQNAKAFFDPASLVKACRKRSFRSLLEIPRLRKRFAGVLRDARDTRYLCAGASALDSTA